MDNWTETYRGTVPPWECDITEHFTIAYYFDRLGEAERNLAEALGLREFLRGGRFRRRFDLRFTRELRAGASFHIDSAPISLDGGLRLGHRFVDSANGTIVTWIAEHWELPPGTLPSDRQNAIGSRLGAWEGPVFEERPEPQANAGFVAAARGRVKPGDLSANGRFSMAAMVNRFTDAAVQTGAAIGMDAETLEKSRRGLSTFELALRINGSLEVDEPYVIETGIAHFGNSSLRLVHRLSDPRGGAEVARLGQYAVNLDLDARRPAPWPDEVRARAQQRVVRLG
ncbi:MAG TPA: thioesterase family protein [Stellaceae bacterium]|nr:thioesterase family protein [Stellaceae bacterium]